MMAQLFDDVANLTHAARTHIVAPWLESALRTLCRSYLDLPVDADTNIEARELASRLQAALSDEAGA